jgi:hypothetical protein
MIPVNIGTIAAWAVSRIWGLPIGPGAGTPENAVVAGVVATLLEVFVVVTVASALIPRVEHSVVRSGWYKGALATTAVAVTLLVAPAIITAAGGHDHTHVESDRHAPHGSGDGDRRTLSLRPPRSTTRSLTGTEPEWTCASGGQ